MKTLVSRNLVGFLYTLCITAAVAGLDCIMVHSPPLLQRPTSLVAA